MARYKRVFLSMSKQYKSRIETPTESHVVQYPWAIEFAQKQQSIFWPAEEIGVEDDEADFRHGLSEAEKHGVLFAQSILTKYEDMIGGDEFWGSRIAKLFPRPEIIRMCACFSNVELGSHAPFYRIGNEVIGVATDEFYSQWRDDPVLAERIAFMDEMSQDKDSLVTTAALAFMEGAVLFSIFGYFKGFNSRGSNKIPHFVSGIDASTKDENFHSLASAALFTICRKERMAAGNHSKRADTMLNRKIEAMAKVVYEHELRIIEGLFAKGDIPVITKSELIEFLEDRINIVLSRLGQKPMFDHPAGVVSEWFYAQLSTVKVPDFFAATQVQYTKNWKAHKLTFRKPIYEF